MSSEADINAAFRKWRDGIKRKFRGIAGFHDRAAMRFEVIEKAIFPERVTLDEWRCRRARHTNPGQYDWTDEDWWTLRIGEMWGEPKITGFFRRTIEIPEPFRGRKLALRIYVGGDGVMRINGTPYHGLDPFRYVVPLNEDVTAGGSFDVEIEQYIAWHCGPTEKFAHTLDMAELAVFDEDVHAAYWDLKCAEKALEIPDIDESLQKFLEKNLWDAMKLVPLQEADPASLREKILAAGRQVRGTIYACDRFKGAGLQNLVGHSHLDIVYMWPEREYIRKLARTHSTMLRLMEIYPQFCFSQSQAKLYADLKKHYPALFEQIKARVAEGRWEPIGAFWVEPDCNLISGESFVRQILHGQQFFQNEFGLRSRTCWQPDVFGLSWGLVQILARSGVQYLISNKMVPWSDTNDWTLHTFHWEGLDGSRVLGIIPPGHFIGTVDPDMMVTQWRAFSDKQTVGETLHVFGWGDGGGGPDIEEIEGGLRYADFPGMTPTKFNTAEASFDSIAEKVTDDNVPTLRDEIYLEAHRGTFTTKGRIKKLNRRHELLCRDAEMAASFAWLSGEDYPEADLHAAWERLLNTQFHDAVPGTHVNEVWHDLLNDHAFISATAGAVKAASMEALLGKADATGDVLVVLNPTGHARSDVLTVPAGALSGRAVLDDAGNPLPRQAATNLDGTEVVLVRVADVPPCGYRTYKLGEAKPPRTDGPCAGEGVLENELLRAVFNERGEVVSLLDKEAGREVLVEGRAGNRFQLFEDTPGVYDAWDIVDTYREHEIDITGGESLRVDEVGPIRASLLLEKPFAGSKIRQRICLYAGEKRLRFETEVKWTERQRLLKVAFPVEVNTRTATYDIAFGNMDRPNHRNTPYDAAKFEVPAHQWMDMSQGDYGVSLLNDCKYGHEAAGKMMRLSLLKGSIHPDPESDIDTHHFTYALMPHAGTWREGETVRRALELNVPLTARVVSAAPAEAAKSYIECDAPGVTLEAVKRSMDGQDLIVRMVERHNGSPAGTLQLAWPVKQAWSCNLMEENEDELPVSDGAVRIAFRPYEIKTIRLKK